ncbi:hypothetical protein EMM73_03460 [Rheinheimera sediminis]|uniref:hypothetical protein n=1 Tax=Rheinheimera sp. YQF-1 TaxID=2499626 RepID=UPI000FDBB6EA|nr:hypothetical protein [Rheinheimera sp. YQF-1]RVT47821.1 hypothetical protein EMM73_03460 [Rheinheimera sp. YQF-1]
MIFALLIAAICWFFGFKLVIWLVKRDENLKDKVVTLGFAALFVYGLVTCTFGLQYLASAEKRGYGQALLAFDLLCLILVFVFDKVAPSTNKTRDDLIALGLLGFPVGWSLLSGFWDLSAPYWLMALQFVFMPFTWLAEGFS